MVGRRRESLNQWTFDRAQSSSFHPSTSLPQQTTRIATVGVLQSGLVGNVRKHEHALAIGALSRTVRPEGDAAAQPAGESGGPWTAVICLFLRLSDLLRGCDPVAGGSAHPTVAERNPEAITLRTNTATARR
jgi:hypothetical protein